MRRECELLDALVERVMRRDLLPTIAEIENHLFQFAPGSAHPLPMHHIECTVRFLHEMACEAFQSHEEIVKKYSGRPGLRVRPLVCPIAYEYD